jgi:LuxR family maltose regulon positive regulatory protein
MPIPLIRTKLHRPPVARDHLHRQSLLDRLDTRRHRPLTLVSAPAGYGKSTLLSCWLESCNCPTAWISLDANDSDLRIFMAYLLEAIESMFPGSVRGMQAMLKGTDLPSLDILAASLINDLYKIDKHFILVLDDYHTIRDKDVHELV